MRVSGIPYVQGRNAHSDADGTKYGIAIHNTANDATAEGEASYATRRTDGISAHFYVDADSVIQSLDTRDRAGHAGSTEGNQHGVAVEITGTNDKSRSWWLANVAWDKLGAVLAQVCRAYNIQVRRANVGEMDANPKVRAFYSHNDMRLAWGGTTHTDPGPNFPWDRLFQAVNAHLDGGNDVGTLEGKQAQQLGDSHYVLTSVPMPDGTRQPAHVVLGQFAATLAAIASKVDIDPAELAQIQEAARAGAASAADDIVTRVLAGLPEGTLTRDDVAAAVREVLLTGVGTQA